jgi:hypothetical protein
MACASAPEYVRVAESGRIGGEDEIRGEGDFHRAGRAVALHGRDDRLGQIGDLLDHLGMEMRLGARLDVLEDLGHIVAGGEITAGTAQNHEPDRL